MKIAGILLIWLSCSGFGFQLAWQYSLRIRQCLQIEQCLRDLMGEIRFHQVPLAEALRRAGGGRAWWADSGAEGREKKKETVSGNFPEFLQAVSRRLDRCDGGDFRQIWEEEWINYRQYSLLREEADQIGTLGQRLGYLDLTAQTETLAHFLEQWRGQIDELKAQEVTKGRLYRYLGVFAGFFLAILLI